MADGAVDRAGCGQDEATADIAIAYAVERDWLIAAGNPGKLKPDTWPIHGSFAQQNAQQRAVDL
jgi:hypothetical protein